jgi:hypothetical protein
MKTLFILLISLLMTACGNWNSIYRQRTLDPEQITITSVDAKQRLAFVVDNNYCSEPSPDAFSVYSATVEAKASKPDSYETALRLATGETGSTLGIRTEVIQLMRDAMYRLCEAHASGALTQEQYAEQITKYQKSMVTLLAINQITSAVKPPNVIINSSSSLSSDNDLYEVKMKYDAAVKDYDTETDKLNAKNKEMSEKYAAEDYKTTCTGDGKPTADNNENCNAYAALEKERDAIKVQQTIFLNNKTEWKKVLDGEESKINLATTSSNVVTPLSTIPQKMTEAEITVVAKAVTDLVNSVYADELNVSRCIEISVWELEKLKEKITELEGQIAKFERATSTNDKVGLLKSFSNKYNNLTSTDERLVNASLLDLQNESKVKLIKYNEEKNNLLNSEKFEICEVLINHYIKS